MNQTVSQFKTMDELIPKLEDAYGKISREQLLFCNAIFNRAVRKNYNTSIPQLYIKIPKVLNFDEMQDGQQDPAKTIPQELPKAATDVDTSKSQWYLEIPKAITAIQWTGNNQQAMEEFCNNGRYRLTDNGDGTLRLADSERTSVINQGDYVASLKSGFSIYKADDFVREFQFIEKNSDAAPAGFEVEPTQQEQLPPPPPEGELPPPPPEEGQMEASFSIKDIPGQALNKVKSINNTLNKGNWIEKFQSNNIHDTGKQLVSKLPGQDNFDIEQHFGIIGGVKSFVGDTLLQTATNAVGRSINRIGVSNSSNSSSSDNSSNSSNNNSNTNSSNSSNNNSNNNSSNNSFSCPTLEGVTAIVIKKHIPSFDTQVGVNINQEIDNLLRDALAGALTKPTKKVEETEMTEIFGLDRIL